MVIAEQNWQPMIDAIWENRTVEDCETTGSTVKTDFMRKWHHNRSGKPISLDEMMENEDGEYISAYACDAKTADSEFLLSKRQYRQLTGREQASDVIAYQIRQSFKPGEVTPEEANQLGYEFARRFTKIDQDVYKRQTPRSSRF